MQRTITYEWKLHGLKALFDGSKGDAKSKVTKSFKFDGGRWQILFYANSGTSTEPSTYCSLYLSCEPTVEEQEAALNGKWTREGVYTFNFELGSCVSAKGDKRVVCTTKEAHDLSFSHKTGNWGWASFVRRDTVYYNQPAIVLADAFVITCSITGPPHAPPPPRSLMLGTGALLDDEDYSDVTFVLPRGRTVCAMKKLLSRRAAYFESMFNSGFSEALPRSTETDVSDEQVAEELVDDSDYEDDEDGIEEPEPSNADDASDPPPAPNQPPKVSATLDDDEDSDDFGSHYEPSVEREQHVPPPATPLPTNPSVEPRRPIARVTVRDAAYSTYRALLYYLYTDIIMFAPLSSSFTGSQPASASTSISASAPSLSSNAPAGPGSGSTIEPASRREWIAAWCQQHPARSSEAGPCSAKSMYRLADKLHLPDLKARAFAHIISSLTVHNIVDEVFGAFSATFAEVRKVEVAFFLAHWGEIRASAGMRAVWPAIRQGRHPGFEQVWPTIVMSLEFSPNKDEDGSSAEVMSVST